MFTPIKKKKSSEELVCSATDGSGGLSTRVTVECKQVDCVGGDARDDAVVGSGRDVAAKSSSAAGAQEAQEVGAKTGDVGCGHAGAGDGVLKW